MNMRLQLGLLLALSGMAFGCSSDAPTTPSNGSPAGASGASVPMNTAGMTSQTSTAGMPGTAGSGIPTAGKPATAGAGTAGMTGSAGMLASAGAGGVAAHAGGSAATAGSAGAAGGASGGASLITGTLGKLGDVKPIVNAWATTNGPETLIYLTTSTLTCADMMTMGVKWLSKLPAGTQVIEVIVPGTPTAKSYSVGFPDRGEVNYAEGSKSSSSEVVGTAGTIVFSTIMSKKLYEGTINVTAPFTAMGTFHAEWCQGGAEF